MEFLLSVQARFSLSPTVKKGNKIQQVETGVDHALESGFFKAHFFQKHLLLFRVLDVHDLLLQLAGQHHHSRAFFGCVPLYGGEVLVFGL